jgi:phosphoenolpyruvate-protein kinase (PTS system EI component)
MKAHAGSEATLAGRSIAPGLAMGPAWVVSDPLHWVGPATPIGNDDVEKELIRLRHSFEETLAELDQHAQRIEGEFDAALAGIFRATVRCCAPCPPRESSSASCPPRRGR